MAIKIIKEGKKEYYITCFQCGCEFSYELEDINYNSYVECPCCGKSLYHIGSGSITISNAKDGMTIPFINTTDKNPCETCSWYEKMKSGIIHVGDIPCTWCQYGQKVTIGTATSTSVPKLD